MVWAEHIATNIKMKKFKDPHQILQVWFSSSFPIGSYAYSHGLEALIDDKKIKKNNDVKKLYFLEYTLTKIVIPCIHFKDGLVTKASKFQNNIINEASEAGRDHVNPT